MRLVFGVVNMLWSHPIYILASSLDAKIYEFYESHRTCSAIWHFTE